MVLDLDYRALDATLSALKKFRIPRSRLKIKKETLGYGGFGEVKLAVLSTRLGLWSSGTVVAVKQLRQMGEESERARVAFSLARELTVWADLEHPNILPFVGFYLDSTMEVAWLVSTFESNGNIRQFLDKVNPDSVKRLELSIDTARGLAYLHTRSPPICHADIKSANVIVNSRFQAMLCDFGLAKVINESPTGLTTSRSLKGSVRYLSPELLLADDPRHTLSSDIWAWGCLFLEVMTDHYPYESSAVDASIIRRITQDERPASIDTLPLPDSLKSVLEGCWEYDPRFRRTIHHYLATLYSTVTVGEYFKLGAPGFLSPDNVVDGLQKQEDDYSILYNPHSSQLLDVDLLLTLPHDRPALCAQISPDQSYVAVGGCGVVTIYMLFSGDVANYLWHPDRNQSMANVSFRPTGRLLATSGTDGHIQIWDYLEGTVIRVLKGHTQSVRSLCFSQSGRILVSGADDRTIRVWNTRKGDCRTLSLQTNVLTVAISPDEKHIAAGCQDNVARVWDLGSGDMVRRYSGHQSPVYSVGFLSDGLGLVSGGGDNAVRRWDLGRPLSESLEKTSVPQLASGPKGWVSSIAASPDGAWIASASKDGVIRFWDSKAETITMALQGHVGAVMSLHVSAFSGRSSGLIASAGHDGSVKIWRYGRMRGGSFGASRGR